MEYRALKHEEILSALHMVWDVFSQDVAPDYTQQGIDDFRNFILYENIENLWNNQQLLLFGAVDKQEVMGVIALQPNGMIRLFYVRKDKQGQGIGKQLFQMAYNCCAQNLKVTKIWVHAAPGAVEKYQHLGMVQNGPMQTENGKMFVPMEMTVSPKFVKPVKEKTGSGRYIALIIGGVLLLILLFVGGSLLIRNLFVGAVSAVQQQEGSAGPGGGSDDYGYGYGYGDDYGYDFGFGDDFGDYGYGSGDGESESEGGLDAIPAYISSSLSYEIGEDTEEVTDESMTSTLIYFEIDYPTVTGLGDEMDEKVNQLLKDCATQTMDEIYTNPSDEIKERVLEASNPILSSEVSYKVCYANENFISVAFNDYCYEGNSDEYAVKLRCLNINLKDGSVYELTDLVNVDESFEQAWLAVMRSEVNNSVFLSELSDAQLIDALKGDSMDGAYKAAFFVDEDGVEIGFSLRYKEGDENDLGYGWVTAPFTFSEIEPYETDNSFWQSLD